MRREFVKKMLQAKRMEVQAFKELLPEAPDEIERHLDVISQEVKAMCKDVVRECIWEIEKMAVDTQPAEGCDQENHAKASEMSGNKSNVKKVLIQ